MNCVLALLLAIVAMVASSPIHGIWNNLPAAPVKRVYGFYNYLPKDEDDRDKRNTNTLFYWAPLDDYVQ